MRKFSKLAIVGTIGLVGIGAWTLPAAAATPGVAIHWNADSD
jgi:hypothetical protein